MKTTIMTKAKFNGFKRSANNLVIGWNDAIAYALHHAGNGNNNTQPLNDLLRLAPCRTEKLGNLTAFGKTLKAYIESLDLPFLRYETDKKRFQFVACETLGFDLDSLPLFSDYENKKDIAKAEKDAQRAIKKKEDEALKRAATEAREALLLAEREQAELNKKLLAAEKQADSLAAANIKDALQTVENDLTALVSTVDDTASAVIEQSKAIAVAKGNISVKSLTALLQENAWRGLEKTDDRAQLLSLQSVLGELQTMAAVALASLGTVEKITVDEGKAMESLQVKPSAKAKAAGKKAA